VPAILVCALSGPVDDVGRYLLRQRAADRVDYVLRRQQHDHRPGVAGTCRRCGEPAASNLLYNCEACADELHANRRPLKETDPEGYQRAVAWLERQRDKKAAWLTEAEQVLAGLAADDPRRELGMAKWWEGLRAYEQMCKAILEPAAEHCLDCGRPSPRGLTPCDGCVHQGRHR
jgi:hypothetical protein